MVFPSLPVGKGVLSPRSCLLWPWSRPWVESAQPLLLGSPLLYIHWDFQKVPLPTFLFFLYFLGYSFSGSHSNFISSQARNVGTLPDWILGCFLYIFSCCVARDIPVFDTCFLNCAFGRSTMSFFGPLEILSSPLPPFLIIILPFLVFYGIGWLSLISYTRHMVGFVFVSNSFGHFWSFAFTKMTDMLDFFVPSCIHAVSLYFWEFSSFSFAFTKLLSMPFFVLANLDIPLYFSILLMAVYSLVS